MKTPSRAAAGLDRASLDALAGLGARIRAARTNLGWTRDALADRILCSRSTLQRMEQGDPRVAIGVVIAAGEAVGVAVIAEPEAATITPIGPPAHRPRTDSEQWVDWPPPKLGCISPVRAPTLACAPHRHAPIN